MAEHAVELLSLLGGFVLALVYTVIWFVKRDRKQIDSHLDQLGKQIAADKTYLEGKAEEGIRRVCAKAEEVQRIAEEARTKAYALEVNYTKRFTDVHDHLANIEVHLIEENGKLKDLLMDRFVTKAELHDFCRFRHFNGETQTPETD